jgi:hypothetical protein
MLGRGVTSPPTLLLSVRPVPPVLFEERDHARILVKVGEGVICVSVNVQNVRSRGFLATYLIINTCIPIYMLRVCVCVYVCMYLCMCICIFLWMKEHMCACICMYIWYVCVLSRQINGGRHMSTLTSFILFAMLPILSYFAPFPGQP